MSADRPPKTAIAARFGRAAATYDAAAGLQAEVAAGLAARLAALAGLRPRTVLEFGCGTGLLTRRLARTWPGAWLIATDLSPGMAAACRRAGGGAAHLAMDAERPALAPATCDLVCGSLAAQWFHDATLALDGLQTLLAPGGVLALTTLGPRSLEEWRAAQARAGLRPTFLAYPSLNALRGARRPDVRPLAETTELRGTEHPDAAAFLRSLSAIGADAGAGSGGLRRLLRALPPGPVRTTYEVITLIWRR